MVIFFFVFLLSGQSTAPLSSEQSIALGYFQQAQTLYHSGDHQGAQQLLDISLQFYPEFSESYFLRALIYLKGQSTTRLGLNYLEQAIAFASWVSTPPEQARALLAEVLLRVGQFERSGRVLTKLGDRLMKDPEIALLWARTLLGLNQLKKAESFLDAAVRRFPYQEDFYLLQARVLDNLGKKERALSVLDEALKLFPAAADLLYNQARMEIDNQARLGKLEEYFASGGSDPGAALLALKSEPDSPERFLELFIGLGGNSRLDYLSEAYQILLGQEELMGELESAAAEFTGTRLVDENRDGFYEEEYKYSNGKLISWQLDGNQDGQAEAVLEFMAEVPVKLSCQTDEGGHIDYLYSDYPFLTGVIYNTSSGRKEYHLIPYQFSLPILAPISESTDPDLRLRLRTVFSRPEENEILEHCFQMQEYFASSLHPVRVYTYVNGRVSRLDEDSDQDGRFERLVHYDRSGPERGYRDLNGDGHYEMREDYSEARLVSLAWDQYGDGKYEYLQVVRPEPMMYWDYNGDGIFDSREMKDPEGGVIREFSSLLNGVFDLKALFRSGKLQRLQRGKRNIPVVYDPGTGLYWIGASGAPSAGFNELASSLRSEGMHGMGMKEYFVFQYQGKIYIEEIQ